MQANKAYYFETYVQEKYSFKCNFYSTVLGLFSDWNHCITLIFFLVCTDILFCD